MRDLLRARLAQGTRTAPFPPPHDALPERFRGLPVLDPSRTTDDGQPPTGLVTRTADGACALDAGACLFAPEEARSGPCGTVSFTRDYRMASRTRAGLVAADGEAALATALDERTRRLYGRSLRLRSVAAGSCAGCEAELTALSNAVFDMARFGVQFVASPRHADGLVVTGAVSRNMRGALTDAWAAVPEPRLVIAVGACAIGGGPFRDSPQVMGGVPAELPVDLWVPGCPPHPFTLLDGLLRLLGRVEDGTRRGG